MTTIDVRL